jgi:hypothetical protein
MITADQVVRAPFAVGRAAVVDPADIAAVAAACLTDDSHNQQVYELTGPEPLSPPDQVAILSQVLGRELRYAEADRPTRSRSGCPTACRKSWRTPSSSNSGPPWTRTTPSRQATSPKSRAARHAASPSGPRPTAPSSSRPPAGENKPSDRVRMVNRRLALSHPDALDENPRPCVSARSSIGSHPWIDIPDLRAECRTRRGSPAT